MCSNFLMSENEAEITNVLHYVLFKHLPNKRVHGSYETRR